MKNAAFRYPDGGFRGWGCVIPVTLGSRTRYFWLTFDRHNGSAYNWSYGNIYCFEAEKFVNVVRFIFPQYGNIMFFANADSAKKFEKLFSIKGELLDLNTNKKYPAMALGSNRTFQVSSLPVKLGSKFDFVIDIAGKKVRLSDQQPSAFITTPAGDYHAIDTSAAAACKVQLIPAAAAPDALLPENGCTASDKDELVWSAVADAKEYNLELKNVSTCKTLKYQLKSNRFPVSKLTQGVWQWSVNVNGKAGRKALITIPEKAETNLAYFYDFVPKMDITLAKAPEELACRIGLLKVDDIDFARSFVLVNNKKYALQKLSSTRIEATGKIQYEQGRNQIKMVIFSKSGVRSDAYWGFFIADKIPIFRRSRRTGKQSSLFIFKHIIQEKSHALGNIRIRRFP
jgi:hypothetical protein